MDTITLPRHHCDSIDEMGLDFFLQSGQGKGKKILVIGESPALNGRIESGRAFYTKSGKIVPSGKRFNELRAGLGVTIEEVGFTELCKCVLGKERNLLTSCGGKSWGHLARQIESVQPGLIVILGAHTLEIFNGLSGQTYQTGVMGHFGNATLLGIYHPSPIHPKSHERNKEIMARNHERLREIIG